MLPISTHQQLPVNGIAAAILADLRGSWRIEREITDSLQEGSSGPLLLRYTGTGEFSVLDSGLHYREELSQTSPKTSTQLRGFREYLYRAENDSLVIMHSTSGVAGGHFMTLEFSSANTGTVTSHSCHLCGADRYEGSFQFSLPESFEITYRVIGPKKNYTMVSRYVRPGSDDSLV